MEPIQELNRFAANLLVAYASAITVVVAGLVCRLLVYHKLLTGLMGPKTVIFAGDIPFTNTLMNFDSARSMLDWGELIIVMVGGVAMSQVGIVVLAVFLSCLLFPALRRSTQKTPVPLTPPEKD